MSTAAVHLAGTQCLHCWSSGKGSDVKCLSCIVLSDYIENGRNLRAVGERTCVPCICCWVVWGWASSLETRMAGCQVWRSRPGRWLVDWPVFNQIIGLNIIFKIYYFMSYRQLNRLRLSTIWYVLVSELSCKILLPEFMSLGIPYVGKWAL